MSTAEAGWHEGLPEEGGLREAIHPGLELQAGVLGEGRDDQGEDERQADEHGWQDHLGHTGGGEDRR